MNDNNRIKLCFFDDFWLRYKSSTMRRWFTPQYFSHFCDPDPAFGGSHYSSLIPDKESGQYRLYYCGFNPLNEKQCVIALSESNDLKSFEPVKIKQGNSEHPGHVIDIQDRGVDVSEHGVNGVVIYDKFESDPARRYKLMCYLSDKDGKRFNDLKVVFSADGLHWDIQDDLVVGLDSHSDTLNRLYYNPCTKEYCLIHRSTCLDRRVALKRTKDFKEWTPSKTIFHPGPRYNSDDSITELYGMTAAWHDGIFLAITWPFHMKFYETLKTPMNGYIESELVYSYDGEHFMETTNRPLVERPNPPHQGCAQTAFTDISESLDGSEYIITAWANNVHHSSAVPEMIELQEGRAFGAAFYKIRKDGFCGIEGMGGGAPGIVITRPLQLLEDDLTINVNASCGIARFAIMIEDVVQPDEQEKQRFHPDSNLVFYKGFSFDDCVPLKKGDSVDHVPQWKEHKFKELVGKRAYVAVELKCAILHAITLTAKQEL